MVELKKITWDNFWDIIAIQVPDAQEKFIVPITTFMAEAYVNVTNNLQDICFAVYEDDILIGFTKIVYVPQNETTFNFKENTYMIDALIIDKKYQHKGYGNKALEKIFEFMHSKPFGEFEMIRLSCYIENINALKFYEKHGFIKTKQFVNKNENLIILELSVNRNRTQRI